jgi:Flp pilus assembly pilin Flp
MSLEFVTIRVSLVIHPPCRCWRSMLSTRARRLMEDCGQALAEYALILALASLGVIFAVLILQDSLGTTFQGANARIDAASATTSPADSRAGGGAGTGAGAGAQESRPDGHGSDDHGSNNR